jgi:hypothetical protein
MESTSLMWSPTHDGCLYLSQSWPTIFRTPCPTSLLQREGEGRSSAHPALPSSAHPALLPFCREREREDLPHTLPYHLPHTLPYFPFAQTHTHTPCRLRPFSPLPVFNLILLFHAPLHTNLFSLPLLTPYVMCRSFFSAAPYPLPALFFTLLPFTPRHSLHHPPLHKFHSSSLQFSWGSPPPPSLRPSSLSLPPSLPTLHSLIPCNPHSTPIPGPHALPGRIAARLARSLSIRSCARRGVAKVRSAAGSKALSSPSLLIPGLPGSAADPPILPCPHPHGPHPQHSLQIVTSDALLPLLAKSLTAAPVQSHPSLPLLPSAGQLDDLYMFDPGNMTWTLLSATSGQRPTNRFGHGFTAAGGVLYVHGGYRDALPSATSPSSPFLHFLLISQLRCRRHK